MKRRILIIILGISLSLIGALTYSGSRGGAPPYDIATDDIVDLDRFGWLQDWKRPLGPARIGLQAGHWKNDELPDELASLRGSTGSTGGGKSEWEVNLTIAEHTKAILEQRGIQVDILPATVPEHYWADVFVAIHADGNIDTRVHGFKIATPRRDMTKKAHLVLGLVKEAYAEATGLSEDPNVSRNMRGYYAFSWWRRKHAVHPMAASIILETGFLTNASDRRVIVSDPERAALGLANGLIAYLASEQLLETDTP